MQLYLIYFVIGLLGMAFQVVMKMQSTKSLADKTNVIFKYGVFLKDNILSMISNLIAVILLLFFIPELEVHYPAAAGWIRVLFGTFGYAGSSILTWAFSTATNRITSAAASKAAQADILNNTTTAPTPATKP